MNLRGALIDDHQPFRDRLRALLSQDVGIKIVAEAGSGPEILETALTTDFDMACMDISMPGMTGIEATRRLLAIRPQVRVIGLSAYSEPLYVDAMLDAGAVGFFTKADAGESLMQAIRTATREHPCFGANIAVPTGVSVRGKTQPPAARKLADIKSLGEKDTAILVMIGKGMASPSIARSLSLEHAMIDVYRRNIMRKLHLPDEPALARYACAFIAQNA